MRFARSGAAPAVPTGWQTTRSPGRRPGRTSAMCQSSSPTARPAAPSPSGAWGPPQAPLGLGAAGRAVGEELWHIADVLPGRRPGDRVVCHPVGTAGAAPLLANRIRIRVVEDQAARPVLDVRNAKRDRSAAE